MLNDRLLGLNGYPSGIPNDRFGVFDWLVGEVGEVKRELEPLFVVMKSGRLEPALEMLPDFCVLAAGRVRNFGRGRGKEMKQVLQVLVSVC